MDKKMLQQLADDIIDMLIKKNADYSHKQPFDNLLACEQLGIDARRGILVRILDKVNRINALIDHKQSVNDETINDSIKDLIGYAMLLYFVNINKHKITNTNNSYKEKEIEYLPKSWSEYA